MKLKQLDLQDCGAGVIRYLVWYYKGNISLERLRQMTCTTKDGTNMFRIKETLIKLGFNVAAKKLTLEQLANESLPVIVQQVKNGYAHFVVITKITDKEVHLYDPSLGNIKHSILDSQNYYSGYTIVAIPRGKIVSEEYHGHLKKLLLSLLSQYKYKFFIIMILSSLFSSLLLLDSFFLKTVIDQIDQLNFKWLFGISIFFISAGLIRTILGHYQQRVLLRTINEVDNVFHEEVITKLFRLPISFFSSRTTGEVTTRVNAINNFRELLIELIGFMLSNLIFFILASILLFTINPMLYLISMGVIALLILLYWLYQKHLNIWMHSLHESEATYQNKLIEFIGGINTIYHLVQNKFITRNLQNLYLNYLSHLKKYFLIQNNENTLKNFIIIIFNYALIIYCIILVKNNQMSIGVLVQFNAILIYFLNPIERLFALESLIKSSHVSYQRLLEMFEVNYDLEKIEIAEGNIEFTDVSFSYDGINPILSNINLKINKGDKVLLTGESGAGKSTLFKLLLGYDENYEGQISIDNIDVKNKLIHEDVRYISQGEGLFVGTLRDNIIGKNEYEETKYDEVIKLCSLEQVANKFSDTYLSEGGHNLSGGERQRVVLARSLYQDFKILILDETLSEVDRVTEEKIIAGIITKYDNSTIIYISHHPINQNIFNRVINLERN